MAKKKESEEETYFVGVKYPNDIRRNILESQKGAISFLRRYEEIKRLRTAKTEKIEKLNHTIDDINKLVAKIRRDLPRTKLRQELPESADRKVHEMEEEGKAIRSSEIEKLNAELANIEKKLKNIS
jgi:archaellum component FlaC